MLTLFLVCNQDLRTIERVRKDYVRYTSLPVNPKNYVSRGFDLVQYGYELAENASLAPGSLVSEGYCSSVPASQILPGGNIKDDIGPIASILKAKLKTRATTGPDGSTLNQMDLEVFGPLYSSPTALGIRAGTLLDFGVSSGL